MSFSSGGVFILSDFTFSAVIVLAQDLCVVFLLQSESNIYTPDNVEKSHH